MFWQRHECCVMQGLFRRGIQLQGGARDKKDVLCHGGMTREVNMFKEESWSQRVRSLCWPNR